ncbi:MAG: NADPH-dependent FMN reductase [Actinomycetaceae bacterium]|nr:NADPH-dependent FMN reductase [Actinomycetaceae bacterium]
MKIAYIVGSLAVESYNRGLAKAIASLAPEGVEFVEIPIADLPVYNRDYDGNWPESATAFKQAVIDADGILLVSPEHNRMYSAAMANAIEWSSRPWGTAALTGKPVAIAGTSPGAMGTALGQSHLRGPLNFFGCKLMAQPEGYFNATTMGITPEGGFNEDAREFLAAYASALVEHVRANA